MASNGGPILAVFNIISRIEQALCGASLPLCGRSVQRSGSEVCLTCMRIKVSLWPVCSSRLMDNNAGDSAVDLCSVLKCSKLF